MPKGLRDYWAKMRANPKKKSHRQEGQASRPAKNPSPARRLGPADSSSRPASQTLPLLGDAVPGPSGLRWRAPHGIRRGQASSRASPPTRRIPFVLRFVGVVQFAAGAVLAIKVPKARGVGLGLCIAGFKTESAAMSRSSLRTSEADDESMLAYQPIEAPVDLGSSYYMSAPVDLGADNFLAAPVDLGADESDRYGY